MSDALFPDTPDEGGPSVVHAHTADDFCDHLLDYDRWWPLVVVTSPPDGEPSVAVDELCRALGPVAEVAAVVDQAATFTMTDRLGRRLSCFGGAINIVPPLGQEWGHLENNLFLLWKLRQMGQQRAIAVIRKSVDAMLAEVARNHRRPQAARTRATERPRVTGPRTPEEVLREVAPLCSRLEFLPSAYASAGKSPYRWLSRLRKLLLDLDAIAEEMFDGPSGQGWHACAQKRGVDWKAGISQTTLGMFGTHYHFGSGAERQLYEQHVTLANGKGAGNCLSVHMRPDPERRRLVIAYVGEHLPYASG